MTKASFLLQEKFYDWILIRAFLKVEEKKLNLVAKFNRFFLHYSRYLMNSSIFTFNFLIENTLHLSANQTFLALLDGKLNNFEKDLRC